MVSQDVEDSLSKRFFKWLVVFLVSMLILLFFLINPFKASNFRITLFILVLLFTLIAALVAIFNYVVWQKVKKALKAYYQGNYERAKDLAIKAYKLSSYREINELIEYIESQIIDEIISQQERLETEQTGSDFLYDLNDLQSDVEIRIKKNTKYKQEIEEKLKELHEQLSAKANEPQLQKELKDLIEKYTNLSKAIDYKLDVYQKISDLINELKKNYQDKEKILLEQEDFLELKDKIMTEGKVVNAEDDDVKTDGFYNNEKILVQYIKEFLASTESTDDINEFSRIYKEFNERVDELKIDL